MARNHCLVRAFGFSLLLSGASCSVGGEIGPAEESLVGTWHATGIEFVSKSTSESVDAFALGWNCTLALHEDNTGALEFTPASAPGWSWIGPWEVDGDLFRIGGQGADITLHRGVLTLSGFDAMFDFDGAGAVEPAKVNMELIRAEP